MPEKKSSFSWMWAAALLVLVQLFVLGGLWQLRHRESHPVGGWDLDPQAAQREAVHERDSREALRNLPLPTGAARLTVAGAQAAAPTAEDLLAQARELQSQGQLDLADKLLLQARQKDPSNQRIQVAAALLAEAQGDTAGALVRWRELIRASDPGGPVRKLSLARAHLVEERIRLEQVAKLREETLAKQPRKLALTGVEDEAIPSGRKVGWKVRAVEGAGKLDPGKIAVRVSFFERGADGVLRSGEASLPRWDPAPPLQSGDGVRRVLAESRTSPGCQYGGYVWQLYYGGELQDERVTPTSLRGVLREKPRS
jgi:tetratricopeptide (TPR) repeat protein